MAFNSGIMWNMADSGAADWGDIGDFGSLDYYNDAGGTSDFGPSPVYSGGGGGAADTGINPLTGNPTMDFTGMAPGVVDTALPGSLDYGPGAVTMPSGGVYDILNTPQSTVTDTSPYTPLDTTPGELPDWYKDPNTTADNYVPTSYVPVDTGPSSITDNIDYTTPTIDTTPIDTTIPADLISPVVPDDVPTMTITDNRPVAPVTPEDDVPTMTITDTRPPVAPVTPEDDVPTMTITDTRPPKEIVEPLPPVIPEPEVPTLTITDTRPVVPVEPPIIDVFPPVEPPIVEPPEPPEPPIVEPPPPPPPPIVDPWEPPIPPIVVPPVPPVVPPPPPPVVPVVPTVNNGYGLNPGLMQTTPFYNTTNDAQAKYYWGDHGFQTGPTFNAAAYNAVQAPATPWGAQGVARPLTAADYENIIMGKPFQQEQFTPATRVQAYNPALLQTPVGQLGSQGVANQVAGPVSPQEVITANEYNTVVGLLGQSVADELKTALANNDMTTVYRIRGMLSTVGEIGGTGGGDGGGE